MRRAEQEVKVGQIHAARARLERLARLGQGGAELDYWLGACEEADGHIDAALAAWGRISVVSPRFPQAAFDRARLAIKQGRFALAEDVLEHTSFPPRSSAAELSTYQWQQLYLFSGRYDELRRSIEDEWAGARHRAEVLRKHWLVDDARLLPVDAVRTRLDEAGRNAPEDDRVWLGRAYLAVRAARFAEAEAWLKKCQVARPNDPVVWRARLEWATASDRLGEAIEAMRHLSVEQFLPGQLISLRAWLAAHRGDERRGAGSPGGIAEPRAWRHPSDLRDWSSMRHGPVGPSNSHCSAAARQRSTRRRKSIARSSIAGS